MLKDLLKDKKFIKGLFAGIMIAVLFMIIFLAVIFSDRVVSVFNELFNTNLSVTLEESIDERRVYPDQNLTISFNKDVINEEQINDTQISDLIEFDPPIPSSYRWIDTDRLLILPEQPLKASTKYKLKIDAYLIDNSSIFNKDINIDFKTRALTVESTNMYYSNRGINNADINLRVNFNYFVDKEELKDHLVVTLAEKDSTPEKAEYILYALNNDNSSREYNIVLKDVILGADEKELVMSIAPGLVSVNGTEGMREEFRKEFKISTRRTLMIEGVYSDINYEEGTITINFSDEVDAESIESFISIDEDIDYRVTVHYDRVFLKSEELLSGQNYTLKIRKGIPSEYAFPLRNDYQRMVRMPDLDPLLNFTSPGFYLPRRGNMNLEMKSINVDKVDIRINKVYANNVVHFLHNSSSSSLSRLGKNLADFTLDIEDEYNETELSTIYLGEYLSDEKGIYQVHVHDHDYYWRNDSRFIILTDVGITSKMANDQLLIWASSLKDLDPLDGATVSLLSYTNQVITTGTTDENGLYRVDNIESLIKEYNPYVIVVEYQDDFSFLKLDDGRISLADFNITGRKYLTEGYEAFIYSDRGVYRPGDKANIGILVRGEKVSIPAEFPLNIEILDPTGNTYRDISQKIGTAGEMFLEIDLPSYVKTGKYTVITSAGGERIGSYSFNVEDFIPERIKVEIETDQETYYNGDEASITVCGMNLFGPPASGRKVNMTVKLDSYQFKPAAYSSYTFGDADREWQEINEELSSDKLDENGEKIYNYKFPVDLNPGNMIKTVFAAEVMEDGGRTVSEYKVVDFHPYDTYIGIKPQRDYYGKVNELYPIDYVIVNSEGEKKEDSNIEISIYQIIYHGLWRRNEDGNWYYDSEVEENRIYHEIINSEQGTGTLEFTPEEYGRYKVVMTDTESKSRSSYYFYASGWGYSPWTLTNPDRVEITFNKNDYNVGETAQVQLKTPFNGRAMVTVEREKIYDVMFVDVEENSALIDLEIQEDWKPNIYVTVHLIRSIDSADKHSPVRAFGTESLSVNCSNNSLQINLDDHDVIRPNSKMNVEIEVPGANGQTYLTLAAVDEGILQLTNFRTPDPFAFFYGKKQLNVNNYDLYNLILPEVERAGGQSSPSGGERYAENVRKQNLNPISAVRVKPVSLFAGPVNIKDGKAEIEMDIPEFNGSLRLMAVAFSESSFGSTDKNVIVRNPIVLTPTLPRFIAP
ncbi:MAG: MG2 domain-containing protein, partial [Halanaerobiales bacterium]